MKMIMVRSLQGLSRSYSRKKSLVGRIYSFIYNSALPRLVLGDNVSARSMCGVISFLGRAAFRFSLGFKSLCLYLGVCDDRVVEYPWILYQLKALLEARLSVPGSLLLDVGCSGSLLAHEILPMKFVVIGIDIREHTLRSTCVLHRRENIMNTSFPGDYFDVIIAVSTLEHVGLSVYGQDLLKEKGDFEAVKEICRILKPSGIFLLTVPYIGNGPAAKSPHERQYDHGRLEELTREFEKIREDYFYPIRLRSKYSSRWMWIAVPSTVATELKIDGRVKHGLACLALRKSRAAHHIDRSTGKG